MAEEAGLQAGTRAGSERDRKQKPAPPTLGQSACSAVINLYRVTKVRRASSGAAPVPADAVAGALWRGQRLVQERRCTAGAARPARARVEAAAWRVRAALAAARVGGNAARVVGAARVAVRALPAAQLARVHALCVHVENIRLYLIDTLSLGSSCPPFPETADADTSCVLHLAAPLLLAAACCRSPMAMPPL